MARGAFAIDVTNRGPGMNQRSPDIERHSFNAFKYAHGSYLAIVLLNSDFFNEIQVLDCAIRTIGQERGRLVRANLASSQLADEASALLTAPRLNCTRS